MVVFFDADCVVCCRSLTLLNRLDEDDRLLFASLWGKTAAELGIEDGDGSMAVSWNGKIWRRSEAVRMALQGVGGFWGFGSILLGIFPLRLRNWGYDLIARNRYRVEGKGFCGVPEEGVRQKMLD